MGVETGEGVSEYGVVGDLNVGQEYPVTLGTILPSGRFLLVFKDSKKDVHESFLEVYNTKPKRMDKADMKLHQLVVVLSKDKDKEESRHAFRAQLMEDVPDAQGEILVYAVDEGTISKCRAKDIYYIQKKYAAVQFESFYCVLSGLEFFTSTKLFKAVLEENKSLFDEVTAMVVGFTAGASSLPIAQVEIRTESGVDVNEKLLDAMYRACPGNLVSTKDSNVLASIAHYEETGEVYLHVGEEPDSFVCDMESKIDIDRFAQILTEVKPFKMEELTADNVYVAPFGGDDSVYRAKFLGVADCDKKLVNVVFMDYGNKSKVPLEKIRCAGLLDEHMERIPALCHKVHLKYVKEIPKLDEFADKIADKKFHLDVRSGLQNNIPIVVLLEDDTDRTNFNKTIVKSGTCRGYQSK